MNAASLRALVTLLAANGLVSCSGGGDEASTQSHSPVVAHVEFATPATKTAIGSGVITFTVAPAVDNLRSFSCSIDAVIQPACLLTPSKGEIRFEGLQTGGHQASVEFVDAGGALHKKVHAIDIVRPDVAVFGATPGGITAAIAAADAGKSVVILEPTQWVGGAMSGGLTKTDTGPRGPEIIGGLAAKFFERVRTAESNRGACVDACRGLFDFEPQVGEDAFERMLEEAQVIVQRGAALIGVRKEGTEIQALLTSQGEVRADAFIDASYEGDLIALAGVSYSTAREARKVAITPDELADDEAHAGVQRYTAPLGLRVDPFRSVGNPDSGMLPFIEPRPSRFATEGDRDPHTMAFTYRLCVTDDPTNRIPFERPESYDRSRYEAHARVAQALSQSGVDLAEKMFNPAQTVLSKNRLNFKHDLNGGSTFSTDMTAPGLNQAYIEGDEQARSHIRRQYRDYIRGLLYTWQVDPRFEGLNQKVARFGFCADEFTDRNHWPHQLYVRIGRRMLGAYVMNENDVLQNGRRAVIADPIGFGAYDIDMHSHRYMAAPMDWPDGTRREGLAVEGFLIMKLPDDRPYPISYRALVPSATEATNLLTAVPVSATYVAYSSLRMEPTFMIMGEAAGTAAVIAVEHGISVQDVPYSTLRQRLIARGQRLGQ